MGLRPIPRIPLSKKERNMIERIDKSTGEVVTGPFIRTPWNYDTNAASDETALVCTEPTLAQQNTKDEADINVILERFGITGELPSNVKVPLSGDFTEQVTDFQTAMNMVRASEESFMELPAKVRARFHNNPQELLEFLEDPENRDEAKKLGIVVDQAPPKPTEPILVRMAKEEEPSQGSKGDTK